MRCPTCTRSMHVSKNGGRSFCRARSKDTPCWRIPPYLNNVNVYDKYDVTDCEIDWSRKFSEIKPSDFRFFLKNRENDTYWLWSTDFAKHKINAIVCHCSFTLLSNLHICCMFKPSSAIIFYYLSLQSSFLYPAQDFSYNSAFKKCGKIKDYF